MAELLIRDEYLERIQDAIRNAVDFGDEDAAVILEVLSAMGRRGHDWHTLLRNGIEYSLHKDRILESLSAETLAKLYEQPLVLKFTMPPPKD